MGLSHSSLVYLLVIAYLIGSGSAFVKTAHEIHYRWNQGARNKARQTICPQMLFGIMGKQSFPNRASGVPSNYDALHQQAISSVKSALKKDKRALEVEFPPLTSLNKLGDGSRKSQQQALQGNADFTRKLCTALSQSKNKVWLVCYELGMKDAVGDYGRNNKVQVLTSRDKLDSSQFGSNDVVVAVGPSDESQWLSLARLSKVVPSIVVNGVCNNGYYLFDPCYYFKPISGRGYLIKQYPDNFKVYSASSPNKPLDVEVPFLEQGKFKRPDTRVAFAALEKFDAQKK